MASLPSLSCFVFHIPLPSPEASAPPGLQGALGHLFFFFSTPKTMYFLFDPLHS